MSCDVECKVAEPFRITPEIADEANRMFAESQAAYDEYQRLDAEIRDVDERRHAAHLRWRIARSRAADMLTGDPNYIYRPRPVQPLED